MSVAHIALLRVILVSRIWRNHTPPIRVPNSQHTQHLKQTKNKKSAAALRWLHSSARRKTMCRQFLASEATRERRSLYLAFLICGAPFKHASRSQAEMVDHLRA